MVNVNFVLTFKCNGLNRIYNIPPKDQLNFTISYNLQNQNPIEKE